MVFQGAYCHLQSENLHLKNQLLKISSKDGSLEGKNDSDITSEEDNNLFSRTMNDTFNGLDIEQYSRISPNTNRDEWNWNKLSSSWSILIHGTESKKMSKVWKKCYWINIYLHHCFLSCINCLHWRRLTYHLSILYFYLIIVCWMETHSLSRIWFLKFLLYVMHLLFHIGPQCILCPLLCNSSHHSCSLKKLLHLCEYLW